MTDIMLRSVSADWTVERLAALFTERREKVSDKGYQPLSVTKAGIVPQLEGVAKTDDSDNRKRVAVGDFVINSRSDRKGSSGLSEYDGSVSLINIVLTPQHGHSRFLHYLLKSEAFQEEFYRLGHGIVADLWTTRYSELKGIRVALPDVSTQKAIAAFLDRETARIDQLIEKKERQAELITERFRAQLSSLVAGLDVPTIRKQSSGIDWLGYVPSHWPLTRIGWIAHRITYGFTNPMPSADEGPFLLTANDINDGKILYDTARRTTEIAFQNDITDKSRPLKGDVLLTKDGTLGRVAVHDGQPGCINQSVALIRVMHTKIQPEFLAAVLQSRRYQDRMTFEAGGTTIKHIYVSRVAKMPVALPPLDEQAAIIAQVAKVSAVQHRLRQKLRSSIDTLTEFCSALITAAVTGQIDVEKWYKRGTAQKTLDHVEEGLPA